MKTRLRLILYLLLALIIIGGGYLFASREQIAAQLQANNGIEVSLPKVSKNIQKVNTIDASILNSPRLNSLTNNVVNFNFSNICWRPSGFTQPSSATGTAAVVNCRLGNGLPFTTETN